MHLLYQVANSKYDEFSDLLNSKLHSSGKYPFKKGLIEPYWQKPNHIPYFIEVDGEIAGFVFVRNFPIEGALMDETR